MNLSTKKIDSHRLELSVELNRDELQTYVRQVEQDALADVQIDGFRKGKAPEHLGREQLDAQRVLQMALERALEGSLHDAINQEKLDVFKVSDLSIKSNTADQLSYTVKVTLYPEITLPDLSSVKVSRKKVEVGDSEIDETLEVIRDSRATFTPKETAAAIGDRVEVDFTVTEGGKTIEGGESKNHPLIIGGKNFIPGFEDNLVGMKRSEEKVFSLVAPEDYYQKTLAGKKLEFKVTMKNVQSVQKPELSDQFAQTLGKFQNVDQLRGGIREGIFEEKRQKEKQRVRLAILDAIIAKTEIALPEEIIEDQLATMIGNFEHDLRSRGMELGMYLAQINKTQEDLKKEWRNEAIRQAKIALIVHRVAKEKDIRATEQEVTDTLNQSLQQLVVRGQTDPSQVDLESARRSITEQITNEKTLDFIEGVSATD